MSDNKNIGREVRCWGRTALVADAAKETLSQLLPSAGCALGVEPVREVRSLRIDSYSLTSDGIGLRGAGEVIPVTPSATYRVSVEEVEALHRRIAEINAYPIETIVWTENDSVVNIDPKVIADWKFVGLSNFYFPKYNHPLRRK